MEVRKDIRRDYARENRVIQCRLKTKVVEEKITELSTCALRLVWSYTVQQTFPNINICANYSSYKSLAKS